MTESGSRWSAAGALGLGFITVAVLLISVGAWTTLTTLSGAIIAPGTIISQFEMQPIQHPEGGVVRSLYIQEGTEVKAGGLLIRLDRSDLESQLEFQNERLYELTARRDRLHALLADEETITFDEILLSRAMPRASRAPTTDFVAHLIESETAIFTQTVESLKLARTQRHSRILDIRTEMFAIMAQKEAVETQLAIQQEQVDEHDRLAVDGLIGNDNIAAGRMMLADIQVHKGELEAEIARLTGTIAQLNLEVSTVEADFTLKSETELIETVSEMTRVSEEIKLIERKIDETEIRSPIAGTVLGLMVKRPRTVVQPSQILMQIVPDGGPLMVEVRIPSQEIDEIHIGQEATIVLDEDKTGASPELQGKVQSVSAGALRDETTGATFFRVVVGISPDSIAKLDNTHLQPGMSATVYAATSSQAPLAFLLKPVLDYFRNALRE